jgi:hypothetical protein
MGLRSIARALGRRGGRARARKLSPERRREIAYRDRKSAADAQDLEFLRNLLKSPS